MLACVCLVWCAQGFRCSTLVPDGLHLIGPQVTHLSIEDCYVAQLSGQPTPCPNIRSLHVSQLIDSYDAHDDADIMQSAIIAQLSALPGLQVSALHRLCICCLQSIGAYSHVCQVAAPSHPLACQSTTTDAMCTGTLIKLRLAMQAERPDRCSTRKGDPAPVVLAIHSIHDMPFFVTVCASVPSSLHLCMFHGLHECVCVCACVQELVWEWRPNALLHLIHGFPEEGLWAAVPKLLPTHTLNTLTKLDFPWVALCNEDIETLLGMSVLRDIGFGSLRVTQDYSQRGCQWEQLSCSQLQPDQLARLPLQSVQSLRLRCQGVDDYMMRPDGYRGMQLWVQGALADPGATAAAAAAISRIPRLTVVPSDELQHSENAEVIIILQGQPETEDMVDHLASLELLWATLARGFAHTSHVITLQLHTQYLFCPTFVEGTTKLLLRASPGSVLPRLRLELFQCSFESLTVSERLLHVTAGLPLVVTLHPESVEHVYTALAHAPRHGPSKRLTVQLCCQYNRHNLCRPERKLPKAAGKAGYEIELVYLHGKAKVDAFGALMWRSATGVYRAVEFLTTHNHPVP